VRSILLGLALLLALASPATAQGAGEVGIRLVDAPTDRADDPRAQINIVDHVAPGTVIERRVEVSNRTGEAATLPVYVGDAELRDGDFVPLEPGRTGELSAWSDVEPAEVRLGSGQRAQPVVRIAVPPDASEGERYGVIWVEAPRAADTAVEAVHRVGVRIYLSVGPGGEPPSDFEVDEITGGRDEAGVPTITARLRNTGGRALDVTGELRLVDGPGGTTAGPFPVGRTPVAVGGERAADILLDPGLPDGPWTVELDLRSGRVERTAAVSLTFPEAGAGVAVPGPAPEPPATEEPPRVPAPVLAVAVLLLLLVTVLLTLVLLARRRDDDEDGDGSAPDGVGAARGLVDV
jgi:hypothetical protein